jgi:predicted Zn-dependent peptidase
MLFYSKFTRDTFNELKAQLKQAIVDERQDPDARAAKILSRQLYPLNHRLRSTETKQQLEVLVSSVAPLHHILY